MTATTVAVADVDYRGKCGRREKEKEVFAIKMYQRPPLKSAFDSSPWHWQLRSPTHAHTHTHVYIMRIPGAVRS